MKEIGHVQPVHAHFDPGEQATFIAAGVARARASYGVRSVHQADLPEQAALVVRRCQPRSVMLPKGQSMVMLSARLEKVSNAGRNGVPTGPVGHPLRCSFVDRVQESQRDVEFIALLDAYRATGGLLRWHDLAHLQAGRGTGDHASLSRSISSGELLCFEWNRSVWVPAFQLDRKDLAARAETRRVLAELSGVFDGWSATQWFIAPNAWLADRTPLERMDTHPDAVLDAARADRFAAAMG